MRNHAYYRKDLQGDEANAITELHNDGQALVLGLNLRRKSEPDFVEPYLRTVFAFLGGTDAKFISAGGTAQLRSGQSDLGRFLRPHVRIIENLPDDVRAEPGKQKRSNRTQELA